jgi:predicted nucleotidyltransferase
LPAQIYSLDEIKNIVTTVAPKYGVQRVVLFGSYARGEGRENSDIDLLIDKGAIKGLFQFAAFQRELQEKLNKPVDVLTQGALSERFQRQIHKEEVLLYDRQQGQ